MLPRLVCKPCCFGVCLSCAQRRPYCVVVSGSRAKLLRSDSGILPILSTALQTASSLISFYSAFIGEPPPEMNSPPQLLVSPQSSSAAASLWLLELSSDPETRSRRLRPTCSIVSASQCVGESFVKRQIFLLTLFFFFGFRSTAAETLLAGLQSSGGGGR